MQKEVQARTQKAQEKAGEAPEQSVSKKVSQDVKQESKHDKGFIKAPAGRSRNQAGQESETLVNRLSMPYLKG